MSEVKGVRPIHLTPEVQKEVEGILVQAAEKLVTVKPPIPYERRISNMSNKQLHGELRRSQSHDFRGRVFAEVLSIMLDSHERGMNPYPR